MNFCFTLYFLNISLNIIYLDYWFFFFWGVNLLNFMPKSSASLFALLTQLYYIQALLQENR